MSDQNVEQVRRQQVRKQWVEALRSGEYKQAVGCLRDAHDEVGRSELDGFCCLGVLCDLYAKEYRQPVEVGSGPVWGCTDDFEIPFDGQTAMPPPYVLEWAGIRRSVADTLADLNDHGTEFTEIADQIENGTILKGDDQ